MAALGLTLTLAIVRHPDVAFKASLDGLRLWFEVVLPALLPFFAMAEILMGLGVVHFIGVLLEPFMRPLFRIPGVGAFAVAMGLASGYPIGAKITGELRRSKMVSQVEAERLVSFANTADPLFMVGAVAVGLFGMTSLGRVIALSHYLGAVTVGFLMRFYGQGEPESPEKVPERGVGIWRAAFRELFRARRKDGRPFGTLFGDSVKDSFASMLFIGGCIMIFSVIIQVATAAGVTDFFAVLVGKMLRFLHLEEELATSLIAGAMEITTGTELTSKAAAPLMQKLVAAAAIIAWSGFSVHAQVAAMVYGTDVRILPYIMARAAHALFAALYMFLLFRPAAAPGLADAQQTLTAASPGFLGHLLHGVSIAAAVLGILCVFSLVLYLARRMRIMIVRF